jgi:hypothetical protein
MQSFLDVPADLRRPMTENETKLFVNCMFADMQEYKDFSTLEEQAFAIQVLQKRLVYHEVKVSVPVGVFICSMSKTPGDLVMWAYTLFLIQKKNNKPVTMEDLSKEFPFGFPIEESYETVWDSQKNDNGSNQLDFKANWV